MEIFPLLQARLMVLCFLVGAISGIFFDLVRAVANNLKRRFCFISALCVLTDFLTVLLIGVTLILLSFYFNNGIIRFFSIIGVALGISVYFFSFSRLFLRIFECIIKIFLSILSFVFTPILKIVKKTQRNLQIVSYYTLKALAKRAIWVYNIYVKKYALKRSQKGFLWRK